MSDWLVISIFALLILVTFGVVVAFITWKQKKEKEFKKPNYKAFFILGFIWFPLGIIFVTQMGLLGYSFIGIGFVYLIIGLANRDKW